MVYNKNVNKKSNTYRKAKVIIMNLFDLDIRVLCDEARRFFEESDINAIIEFFWSCNTIEEINSVTRDLYDEIFAD